MRRTPCSRTPRLAALAILAALAVPVAGRAAPPPFRLTTPVVRTLPNGLTVAVFRDPRTPLVQLQLAVPAGSGTEGPLPAGVAYVTSQLVGAATASREPAELQRDLEAAGGRLATRIGRDMAVVSASFLASEAAAGYEIFADVVRNALLTGADFERARRGARALAAGVPGLAREGEDRLWRAAFGDAGYAHEPGGTVASLDAMSINDVRAFYNAQWTPRGAVLAVAGDVEPEAALAAITSVLGSWSARTGMSRMAEPRATPPARSLVLVDRPDAEYCDVWVAAPGPRAGDADEVPIALAAQLAARAAAPVGGVRTSESALHAGGLVWIGTTVRADSVAFAAKRLEAALTGLRNAPPAPAVAELTSAVLGTFPMRFETLADVADQWTAEAALGLGFEHLIDFPARVRDVTPAAIAAAAKRWFDPQRLTFVVVGPAARVRGPLASVAKAAAAARPASPGATMARPDDRRARAVVAKAVAAHGGLPALRKVTDSVIQGDAVVRVDGREARGNVTQMRREPDRLVYDLRLEDSGTRQVLSGRTGWTAPIDTLSRAITVDSTAVAGLRSVFRTDVVHLLLEAADPKTKVAGGDTTRANGKTLDKVELWGALGSHRTLYFDPATHLLAGVELDESGERGRGDVARRWYRDYRAVNGIRLPFTEERWVGGERVMQLTITRYEVNAGVPESMFRRPEAPLPPASR